MALMTFIYIYMFVLWSNRTCGRTNVRRLVDGEMIAKHARIVRFSQSDSTTPWALAWSANSWEKNRAWTLRPFTYHNSEAILAKFCISTLLTLLLLLLRENSPKL